MILKGVFMKFIFSLVMAMTVSTIVSSLACAWSCSLSCSISEYVVHDQISKHAGGPQQEDFRATCQQIYAGRVSPISECEPLFCVTYRNGVEQVFGSGTTLTEARENARKNCFTPTPNNYCGIGKTTTPGAYDCTE